MPQPRTTAPKEVLCLSPLGTTHPMLNTSLKWRPAAYGIILKDSKVLLLKQFSTKYELPGGGVELGEHPPSAAIRETLEETGITVSAPILLGVESTFFRATHADGGSYHSLLFYYACEYVSGEGATDGLEEAEKGYVNGVEWVDVGTLDGLEVGSTVDWRKYVKMAMGAG